ncbi:MAG: hypothetical protein ACPGWR_18085, partial [Ardenticatenaceae bacterium]
VAQQKKIGICRGNPSRLPTLAEKDSQFVGAIGCACPLSKKESMKAKTEANQKVDGPQAMALCD